MDTFFATTDWQPTRTPAPDQAEQDVPLQHQPTVLIRDLNDQTSRICEYPYDPDTWLRRARTLEQMCYPELAVGDATKARVLAAAHLSRFEHNGSGRSTLEQPSHKQQWRLGYKSGFWMLDTEIVQDGKELQVLREYLQKLQTDAGKLITKNLYFYPEQEEGRFRRRPYPWMKAEHSKRSPALISQVNQELKGNAQQILHLPGPTCFVKGHAFGHDEERDTSNILGVFAAHALTNQQSVLIDRTRSWGCNGPGTDGSPGNLHGAVGCLDPIHPNDDDEESSHDLPWVRDLAGRQASNVLLIARLLLCCVQDNVAHPLDHPLIARLTPTYMKNRNSRFSVQDDISIPMTVLQRFGVDVFANPNFDTWVLFTIQARVANNCCGDPIAESLMPLFSLFNHSCEPNVRWKLSDDHRTVTVDALKDLQAGEQLLVEYDGFMSDQPLKVRRQTMWRWLAGPCMCVRCVREEHEQQKKQTQMSGQLSDDGIKVDEKVEMTDEGGWNIPQWELPVFPEDLMEVKKLD